jgi:hypothetical protein
MKWSAGRVHEIMRGMRSRRGGFRVSADTAPLVVRALEFYYAHLDRQGREQPDYRVIEQFTRGPELRDIATAWDLEIALGAFEAAARQWPTSPIVLRDQQTVLKRSGPE